MNICNYGKHNCWNLTFYQPNYFLYNNEPSINGQGQWLTIWESIYLLLQNQSWHTAVLPLYLPLSQGCTWKPCLNQCQLQSRGNPHFLLQELLQDCCSISDATSWTIVFSTNYWKVLKQHSIEWKQLWKYWKNHLATHFPGMPPHHAISAEPLITFPSISSPSTVKFNTFGYPVPDHEIAVSTSN